MAENDPTELDGATGEMRVPPRSGHPKRGFGARLLRLFELLLVLSVFAAGGGVVWANWSLGQPRRVTPPPIPKSSDPDAVARGERLFASACARCHVDPASGKAVGAAIAGEPAGWGTFTGSNLTAEPRVGIGAVGDDELARAIRCGLRADGTPALGMSGFAGLADGDVGALIAYLRSAMPAVAADPADPPRPSPSLQGTLMLAFFRRPDLSGAAERVILAPASGPTKEWGRYLADQVFQCWTCHDGGWRDRRDYAGGRLLDDGTGHTIAAPNLTPSKNGLAGWGATEWMTVLHAGRAPDGGKLRAPMPDYSKLDLDAINALAAYFASLPPDDRPPPKSAGDAPPREKDAGEPIPPATPSPSPTLAPQPTPTPKPTKTPKPTPKPKPKATPKKKKTR